MPTSYPSMTSDDVFLIMDCIRHTRSSDKLVSALNNKRWLRTTLGYKCPSECFLSDSDWLDLLLIFTGFPLIDEKSYGNTIFSYKNELRKLGVVVDFSDAAKAFALQFKQLASSHGITKDKVLLFLSCFRKLKNTTHQFPVELHDCIRDEKWLKTCLGQRSPRESILFSTEWEHISSIAILPFIGESENNYGPAIREYEQELKSMGVMVSFNSGSKFVAAGLSIPQNPIDITSSSVLSLLECIRNIMKERDHLPKEFLSRINKRWLKTHMGYKPPNECLLFGPEWNSLLLCEDASFIDENFYGFDISSFRKELNAIGVIVDIGNGCQLLASQLDSHSQFDLISRIYVYLKKYDWKPDNKVANWVWIPNGSDKGQWVSPEECVLYDKDGLFDLQLNVLEKHYDKKLLTFFSMCLNVRPNPSVDDYCRLWKIWENSRCQLTVAECCAFWACMVKQWNTKTKDLLAEMVKLPVTTSSDIVPLLKKQDVFIPDDLLLVDLFEKASVYPIFVWYPQPSLPSIPRTNLNEIYSGIGVQPISVAVKKSESAKPDGEFKQVDAKEVLIQRELIRLVLGFFSDPSLEMDTNKRQQTVQTLLDVNVYATEEPISVSYSLLLSSGESLNVKASKLIRWERKSLKIFFQKMKRSSGQKANIEHATYFSQVIAEGLLWEKEDRIAVLAELVKLGSLLEFEEDAIRFLLKTKNLQIFMEDEEFLKSAFSTE